MPYTSVLDSTQTLFQVGKVGQQFQQRADSFAFAVVVYLLNGVETLVDIPKLGEWVPKPPRWGLTQYPRAASQVIPATSVARISSWFYSRSTTTNLLFYNRFRFDISLCGVGNG